MWPLTEFAADGSKASGRKSICKGCDREKARGFYAENRDRVLAAANERNARLREGRPPKICAHEGCERETATRHFTYCLEHSDEAWARRRKKRGKTWNDRGLSARQAGYGPAHVRLRRRWKPQVEAGLVDCARCGERIEPGTPWDLGHDDHDRSKYNGPEHAACNRATAGRRPARRVAGLLGRS